MSTAASLSTQNSLVVHFEVQLQNYHAIFSALYKRRFSCHLKEVLQLNQRWFTRIYPRIYPDIDLSNEALAIVMSTALAIGVSSNTK